jgi:hypothetical protein
MVFCCAKEAMAMNEKIKNLLDTLQANEATTVTIELNDLNDLNEDDTNQIVKAFHANTAANELIINSEYIDSANPNNVTNFKVLAEATLHNLTLTTQQLNTTNHINIEGDSKLCTYLNISVTSLGRNTRINELKNSLENALSNYETKVLEEATSTSRSDIPIDILKIPSEYASIYDKEKLLLSMIMNNKIEEPIEKDGLGIILNDDQRKMVADIKKTQNDLIDLLKKEELPLELKESNNPSIKTSH